MAERTLFQSFAPDAVTASVKVEYLYLVAFAVDKHKQLAAEWIFLKLVFSQGGQSIIGLSHIGGLCA